jgi:hypothetical protein
MTLDKYAALISAALGAIDTIVAPNCRQSLAAGPIGPAQRMIELSVKLVGNAGCRRGDNLPAGASDLRSKTDRHE